MPDSGPQSSSSNHGLAFLSSAYRNHSCSKHGDGASTLRSKFSHRDSDDHSMSVRPEASPDAYRARKTTHREHIHHLNLRERVRHFTWSWFCMCMATGGIANLIHEIPYRFHGLYAIGCIFFLGNIVLFCFCCIMISLRFWLYPSTFKASILHPTECLFVPASIIAAGTILINITEYGVSNLQAGEWLVQTMTVLFWFYCVAAVVFSVGIYLVMWSTQTFTIGKMTPIWIFPAYPLLLVGPHASVLARRVSDTSAVQIIIGAVTLQGTGFLVSLMIYAAFLYRLMTQKLPQENLRPGMFISIGPSAFTISGIVGMGQILPTVVSNDFMQDGELAAKVSMILANWAGLWLWGLAIWFLLVSIGAHWSTVRRGRMVFSMTFYSYIFPNTALTTATFAIGQALNSKPIKIVGCVLACLVIAGWMCIFLLMIRAVYLKDILWPQKQEDRAEGGWRAPPDEKATCDAIKCDTGLEAGQQDLALDQCLSLPTIEERRRLETRLSEPLVSRRGTM